MVERMLVKARFDRMCNSTWQCRALLVIAALVLGCAGPTANQVDGSRDLTSSHLIQLNMQIDALERLREVAGDRTSGVDQQNAVRTWRLLTGPEYRVPESDVYEYGSALVDSKSTSGCEDPRKLRSAFALDPVTLYPYPKSLLRTATEEIGPRAGSLVPVAAMRGVWIQSVSTHVPGTSTFAVGVCSRNGVAVRTVELVDLKDLPSDSPGLMRRPPSDSTSSSAVDAILSVDFERSARGFYSEVAARDDFVSPAGELTGYAVVPTDSLDVEQDDLPDGSRNRFLRKKFSPEDYSDGINTSLASRMQFKWTLTEAQDAADLSFDVRVPVGFPATRGGKLPGFCGGSCPTGGKPTTDYQTTDGRNNSDGRATGFSVRTMWGADGYLYQYFYNPDQSGRYADGMQYRLKGRSVYLSDGAWHRVRQFVKLNDPGARNGILRVWFDDQLVLDVDRLRYRDDYSYGIDRLLVHSFFGGGSREAAPMADTVLDMDNLVFGEPAGGR